MTQYCDVYLNRKKMGKGRDKIYSIRPRTGIHKGRSKWFSSFILLSDVSFVVNEGGRQDTLRRLKFASKGQVTKTVHAMLRGSLKYRGRSVQKLIKSLFKGRVSEVCTLVTYNPTKNRTFITGDGKPITNAKYALCTKDGVYVIKDLRTLDNLNKAL